MLRNFYSKREKRMSSAFACYSVNAAPATTLACDERLEVCRSVLDRDRRFLRLDRRQGHGLGLGRERFWMALQRHVQNLVDPLDGGDFEAVLDVVWYFG